MCYLEKEKKIVLVGQRQRKDVLYCQNHLLFQFISTVAKLFSRWSFFSPTRLQFGWVALACHL
jgi:hypothetical protein